MANKNRVKDLLYSATAIPDVSVQGWIRTRRDAKDFSFIELNDGSCLANIQIVADSGIPGYEHIGKMNTGAAVSIEGDLNPSPGGNQKWEITARRLELIGTAAEDFPLQKKRHSDEFLRSIAHLRPRTNKFGAILRIRSGISQAIHDFFRDRGFFWVHTPIITGSDCEGAGELFRVTTLALDKVPMVEGKVDYDRDFFGKEAHLTVSGQLSAEACCMGLGNVYTFGPTFRSENSNTSRHVAEFWMVEPEMAFADLDATMRLGEEMIQYLVRFAMDHHEEDLGLFSRFVDKTLIQRLETILHKDFIRISYSEAIDILQKSAHNFEYRPEWGKDLQSEHERFLTEEYCRHPVIVHDYPAGIKAFYMRMNDDERTVAAMDILVPAIGEIIGGSQREERYDRLTARIEQLGLSPENYWWYLDTRRFGSVPHAGFGLGLERFLMLITGTGNIRDVIPFPRTPRHLDF